MSNKLWGGRFSKKTDPLVEKFTKSIQYDYKLAKCDVFGSFLHVGILEKCGYLTNSEASKLKQALSAIQKNIKKIKPDSKSEDIHSQIQNALQKKVGNLVLKLHTARSRNEQVVFSSKLYSKLEIKKIKTVINELIKAIEKVIEKNKGIIIPGFTHLQHAQPVLLKDYLGAYIEMLVRDSKRLDFISNNLNISIGAGAIAGTPIECKNYRMKSSDLLEELGKPFDIQVANSLDAVSDRDFVIEIISALSIVAMHLSRLAEDLIIWSTKEFDFVEIDESFCTGSSLMPQKKNPDTLELIRGYAGRLTGNLVSVLTMMKGLPLTYNRDMQLDKEPLFESFEIISLELKILVGLIKTLKFNTKKIEEQVQDQFLYATDAAHYLIEKKEMAFKQAHDAVGKLINHSTSTTFKQVFKSFLSEKFPKDKLNEKEIDRLFDARNSVMSKKSIKRKK